MTLDISLIVPVCRASRDFYFRASHAVAFFRKAQLRTEILLILNGEQFDEENFTYRTARELEAHFPEIKAIVLPHGRGKGAAVRYGLGVATGKKVGYTDADFPFDLCFFVNAATIIRSGADLVSGNRRLPDSQLNIPVQALMKTLLREAVGRSFSLVSRVLYALRSRDTQAGVKLMSRRLAQIASHRLTCDGFLFDLELFLIVRDFKWRRMELPVRLSVTTQPSTVVLFREFFITMRWLLRIKLLHRGGQYSPASLRPAEIAALATFSPT